MTDLRMIKNADLHKRATHTMKPAAQTPSGRWVRSCSCGWRARDEDRAVVMAAARTHRIKVTAYAKLVARGHAEFLPDPPPPRPITNADRAELAAFNAAMRQAFR